MKLKILITGGAGFIGSSVYDSMRKKYDIYILDNFIPFYDIKQKLKNLEISSSILKKDRVQNIFNCDIRDYFSMKRIFREVKPHAVIHCAAMAGVQQSFEHQKEYFSVNVEGTLNVFSAAVENNVKKTLFLSSSSVYGEGRRAPFKESYSMNPISPYGMTKAQSELMAAFFSSQMNLDILVLRLFTLYGPRQRPDLLLHKLYLNHMKNIKSVIYKNTSRDYTFIDDGVQGIQKGFEFLLDTKGIRTFNIGSSNPVKTEDVAIEVRRRLPSFSFSLEERKRGDMARTFADISRAKSAFSYQPRMDFAQGVKRFDSWFNSFYKS
ncbi:MAG: GDP-mannose 4,6-dehydratase [bacterium]|nr:GDP-mannose 4,6-dehydratase [bacterium]